VALGDPGAELFSDRNHFVGRAERPGADEDRNLLAGIEHVGGPAEVGVERHSPGPGEAHAEWVPCLRGGFS
jgi:hypothetical protein